MVPPTVNLNNVQDCQIFTGKQRAVRVNFTDGTSNIFDGAEVTDELWAFAATKPMKRLTADSPQWPFED
jgi:hypothetical protein